MRFQSYLFLLLLLVTSGARGSTIVVNSNSGAAGVNDACVLRDAITLANTGTPTGACTVSAPPPATIPDATDCLCTANTIVLPAGATITLTEVDDVSVNTGLPSITGSLTITGNGSTVRRDPALGCNQNGINDAGEFALIYNASTLLVLDHLTLSNGCADSADYTFAKGGAIASNDSLVLQNVVLSDNYASNRGGAIYDNGFGAGAGYVTIADSTISGNAALVGGGIFLEGSSATLTVQRSLFLQNSASQDAGGAIYIGLASTATVINSTFSQNDAGSGGAIEADGIVAVSNSTLAHNVTMYGAALQIETSGTGQQTTVKNSLFAANTGETGNCAFASGAVTIAGMNLSDDASCPGFALSGTDAKLLPLKDNGGPTLTYGLQMTSPAVDAELDCTDSGGFPVTTDQRGFVRPVEIVAAAALCDIGAFELGDDVFHDGFDGQLAN